MGIISSEKIFVDPKEEINFVIDRALKSERDRLIFVIPQNSIILSSPVSINILFKELSKTKKIGMIVTEDEFGSSLAQKAGFISFAKVSQITADEWDMAMSKKLKYLDTQEKRKQELLSNIGLIENNPDPVAAKEEEIIDEPVQPEEFAVADQAIELDPDEIDTPVVGEIEENPQPFEEELIQDEEISETATELEAESFYKKPRNESKVVQLGGIKLATGGDIRNFLNSDQSDKMSDGRRANVQNSNMEDIPQRKVKSVVGSSSFAGKDFTKKVTTSASSGGFFGNLFGGKTSYNSENEFEANLIRREKRKKIMIIAGVIVAVLLLGGGYLFAFQLSSVDLSIKFKKEDISGESKVVVNPDVTEISYNPAVIPAKILREEGLSISKAGEANGTGKKGTKSKGFVTIYNLTDKAVSLPSGTKVTNPNTEKIYLITQAVSLEAGSPSTAYYADNIPIEAVDFGEEYNIPVSSDSTSLSVEGYSNEFASKKLYARVFNEISGGSAESFVSVSQENIDALKEKILPELKTQGESRIRSALPTGYTLISDSIEFTEGNVSSIPKLGEEAADKNFTLSIEGVVTAYAVSNEDLRKIAERVLSDDQDDSLEEDDNLIVDNIELPQITSVEKSDTGIVITISTQGSIGVRPTDESIKNSVAGKSVREALDYLQSIESIEDSRINFTPSFIPESLRRVPSDTSRISIRIR